MNDHIQLDLTATLDVLIPAIQNALWARNFGTVALVSCADPSVRDGLYLDDMEMPSDLEDADVVIIASSCDQLCDKVAEWLENA